MEIDRQTIKALASESRLSILRALAERRKMPAELTRQLGLAGSTVVEHLRALESAGLVARRETGHKWIYYELTEKGESLIRPRSPVQFVLALSLGLIFVFTGAVRYAYSAGSYAAMGASQKLTEGAAAVPTAQPAIDWVLLGTLSAGLVLLIIGMVGFVRGVKLWSKLK
jgi:DNA-binding transcriptional ArsR family regulator